MYDNHTYNSRLKPYARALRNDMTKAEACLWKYALRARQMKGYTFRRQRPIGPYIADFACLDLMLVIEVDGLTHLFEETQIKDARKERYLENLGYTVLRFKDEDVLKSMNQVIDAIERTIDRLAPLLKGVRRPEEDTPASGG
jgi:very-short-patch-repair endonuclease